MKKLALLLAALSVASVSYAKEVMPVAEVVVEEVVIEEMVAAPALRVVSVGQYVEFDNTSGGVDIGEGVHFGNKVNLALGDDWAFGLHARKTWSMDTDDGVFGNGHRLEVSATRKYDGFTVGTKWRGEESYDGLYLTGSYNMGALTGNGYVSYRATNDGGQVINNVTQEEGKADYWYAEMEPIQYRLGPIQLAYYLEVKDFVDETAGSFLKHQVRVRGNFYTGEKVTLGAEYRYEVADVEDKGTLKSVADTQHTAQLSAAYAVNENLTLESYYLYEINKYEGKNGGVAANDDYYGEFLVGWNYKF